MFIYWLPTHRILAKDPDRLVYCHASQLLLTSPDGIPVPTSSMDGLARAVLPRKSRRSASGARAFAVVFAVILAAGMAIVNVQSVGAEQLAPEGELHAAPVTITSPPHQGFIDSNTINVTGTKAEGASVQVTVGRTASCSIPADLTSTWSCTVVHASAPDIAITATQNPDDNASGSSTITIDVLGPPSFGGNQLLTPGLISGSGYAEATITLRIGNWGSHVCPAASATGYWSCFIAAPSGAYAVSAQQSHPNMGGPSDVSTSSGAIAVTIDKDPPAAPSISTPRANSRILSQPMVVAGGGEPDGTIDVYVDGVPWCSTQVGEDGWTCSLKGMDNGAHVVQAVLRDAAGNYALGNSAPIPISVGPAPAGATPLPSPAPAEEPAPAPLPAEAPLPAPPEDSDAPPWTSTPLFPESDGRNPTLIEALTNWGTPSDFADNLPTLAEAAGSGNWLWAPALGLVFVLLIALPLRLLANALRGHLRMPRDRVTGRNQDRAATVESEPKPRNAWLIGAVPLATTAALVVYSEGISGEVRYLRLLLAVGLGLGLINIVAIAIATRLAAQHQKVDRRLRLVPILLAIAAVTAVLSRWLELEPPIVTGALIGASFAMSMPAKPRAVVNLVQIGALLTVGVGGWIGHDLVGSVVGFWPSVLSETLATLCLAGIGSAVLLMLPLGALPGRVILEWSAGLWAATSFAVASLASVITLGTDGAGFPSAVPLIVLGGFAAVCGAVWAWSSFVEPARA